MNCLKIVKYTVCNAGPLVVPCQPIYHQPYRTARKQSLCDLTLRGVEKKTCFDKSKLIIEIGTACHAKMIKAFLYSNYWTREPTITSLWMPLDSGYLAVLTDKYSNSGNRLLAFERMERTNERKLLGVLVANRIYPWMIDELEEWADNTCPKPEQTRMYFYAHCYKTPNLFQKYNVPYFYDVEILGTVPEATGQGVATELLKTCLYNANDMRHPLVHVISLSEYTNKVCERNGMTREWLMKYSDFVNQAGVRLFYPRRPHRSVSVYVKYFDPRIGGVLPCKKPYL